MKSLYEMHVLVTLLFFIIKEQLDRQLLCKKKNRKEYMNKKF